LDPSRGNGIGSLPDRIGNKIMKRNRTATYSDEKPIYFITSSVTERLPIFFDENLCEIVLKELNFYREKYSFAIYAFVIMPTHIHLLVQQMGEENISEFMRSFKSFTTKEILGYIKEQVKAGALTLTISKQIDISTYTNKFKSEKNFLECASQGPALTDLLSLEKLLERFEESALRYHKDKTKSKHQVWQERFDDVFIYSEEQFNIKLDYIHNNPVHEKWNLVPEPQDYKYSSSRNYELDDEEIFVIDSLL